MLDPLSVLKDCKSPSSVSSDDGRANYTGEHTSLASSFVFVESAAPTPKLARHVTAVRLTADEDRTPQPDLLVGEDKQAIIHGVQMMYPKTKIFTDSRVSLVVTNYRLLLLGPTGEQVEIPVTSILDVKSKIVTPSASTASLGRHASTAGGGGGASTPSSLSLDIKTKDCRFFQILVEMDATVAKNSFLKLLNSVVFAIAPKDLFPLTLARTAISDPHPNPYSIQSEFERFACAPAVKISDANSEYAVCVTYPNLLVVPSCVSPETLLGSSRFRGKGRIPVLSWAGPNRGSIWRSSQPKSSLLNRSGDDEEYLKSANVMFIIDCRPMLNAYANIANGAGVESLGNYHSGIELWFASIHNIHHVRDAWEKMFALAQQFAGGSASGSGWFAGLETTGWYELTCSVLKAASVLVEKSCDNISVLCRCSHGLDRTPQVVSLAMLALDPYYRTIHGFAILVEKEWISMGHRFHSRNCIGQPPSDEFSPIFTQWIECVYQLMEANPDAFEFKPTYIMAILFALLSGRFVNFLFDSEKERLDNGVAGESVWTSLWTRRGEFVNHNFVPDPTRVLEIDPRASQIRVFNELWFGIKRIQF